MTERIIMNSESIKKKFPEIYRDFFSKCPLVVSAPGNFWWTGEYSANYGGLAVKQNLPIRTYVGLEPSDKFEAVESLFYWPMKKTFNYNLEPMINGLRITKFLNQYFGNRVKEKVRVHVLAEIPPGSGMAASSAFSSALALSLLVFYKEISWTEFEKTFPLPIYQRIDDPTFNKVFRLAWKLECLFHNNTDSGAGVFCSLCNSRSPIVYFTEGRSGSATNHPKTKIGADLTGSIDEVEKIRAWAFRIDEMSKLGYNEQFDSEDLSSWPIGYGLIFSGNESNTALAMKATSNIYWWKDAITPYWKKIFKNLKVVDAKPAFQPLIMNPTNQLMPEILKALNHTSIEVVTGLADVFTYGSGDSELFYLFSAINHNHGVLNAINAVSPIINLICNITISQAQISNNLGAGAKLAGHGPRGDVLFVAPYSRFELTIDELIDKISNTTQERIWLDYASWLDGFEYNGPKLEQLIKEKIFSEFISEGSRVLTKYSLEKTKEEYLHSIESFEIEAKTIDLLIDSIEGDIYIRGEKLTSKELPSSSSSAEILEILLENLGKNIENHRLPKSSYSNDRNEMQSKIISPLVKAIKARTGKDLQLSLTGGITNFSVKLVPNNLDIRVLEHSF